MLIICCDWCKIDTKTEQIEISIKTVYGQTFHKKFNCCKACSMNIFGEVIKEAFGDRPTPAGLKELRERIENERIQIPQYEKEKSCDCNKIFMSVDRRKGN